MRVGKAYKCPQMNTMKFLVDESFEFGGFVTWPKWLVHSGIAIWLGLSLRSEFSDRVYESSVGVWFTGHFFALSLQIQFTGQFYL